MKKIAQIIMFSLFINTVYSQKEEVVFGVGKVSFKGMSFMSEYNHQIFKNFKVGIGFNFFATDPFKLRNIGTEYTNDHVYITYFSTPASQKELIKEDISKNLIGVNLNIRYNVLGLLKPDSKLKFEVGMLMGWKQITTLTAIKAIEGNGNIILRKTEQSQDKGISPNFDLGLSYKVGKRSKIGILYTYVDYEKGNTHLIGLQLGRLF